MEPTIYKPSIYNGESIYNTGAGGGGGGGGVEILGTLYKTKDIGPYTFTLNCLWSSYQSNLNCKAGSSTLFYRAGEVSSLNSALIGSGWHVPTKLELQSIVTYLNNNGLFIMTELDLPSYHYDHNGNSNTWTALAGLTENSETPLIQYTNNTNTLAANTNLNNYWVVRLLKD